MSNIELVRIDENNFMQAFNLKLAKEQEQFVSNQEFSASICIL